MGEGFENRMDELSSTLTEYASGSLQSLTAVAEATKEALLNVKAEIDDATHEAMTRNDYGASTRLMEASRMVCGFMESLEGFVYKYSDGTPAQAEAATNSAASSYGPIGQVPNGCKPTEFVFQGRRHQVKSWKEVYVKSCELLYDIDGAKFRSYIAKTSNPKRRVMFSETSDGMIRAMPIGDTGIVAETNLGASPMQRTIKTLLAEYSLPPSAIQVYYTCQ